MKITQSEFERELHVPAERRHNLILIGMSGSGKTHWSKLLSQQYKYIHVEFDNLIGESAELEDLIKNIPGKDAAEKMGNYFGMPWSKTYQTKENAFLGIERRFMSEPQPIGSILDLTGSCIYHPKEMEVIYSTGLLIYLETSSEKQREMFEIFRRHPKPVCWGGLFKKRNGETNEQALERSYPLLLAHRAKLYVKFADVTLPYAVHKNIQTAEGFVQEVKKQLV